MRTHTHTHTHETIPVTLEMLAHLGLMSRSYDWKYKFAIFPSCAQLRKTTTVLDKQCVIHELNVPLIHVLYMDELLAFASEGTDHNT